MKCIKKVGEKIRRVSDEEANNLVKAGWKHCPKSEWKKQGHKSFVETKSVETDELPEAPKPAKKAKKAKKTKTEA